MKREKLQTIHVRDGYFKTSECYLGLGNSYYAVKAQNSFGGMSKETSVENKNISLRCCGTFHNPIFCLYFFWVVFFFFSLFLLHFLGRPWLFLVLLNSLLFQSKLTGDDSLSGGLCIQYFADIDTGTTL